MLFKIIKLIIFLVIARHVHKMIMLMGFHITVWNHWPGPCRTVPPIEHGAEDVGLTKSGLAVVTSGCDISYRGEITDPRMSEAEGKLYAFDFNKPDKNAVELKFKADFDFVPQEISVWETESAIHFFVVNHRKEGDTVEIFKLKGTVAEPVVEHLQSVKDPLFTSLNDVIATGFDSFYATNDGYFRFSSLRVFERLLNLPWGSVVHFDGQKTRTVLGKTFEYNGMDMSSDGRFVFIASPFVSSSITIYERSAETNDLTFHQEVVVGNLIDNIFYNPETGDLWCGCAPKAHRMLEAFMNVDVWAPSFVLRVRPLGPKDRPFETYKVYDVFSDDGNLLSSSASATVKGNHLLIGSIHQKMAYCEMKSETTIPRDIY